MCSTVLVKAIVTTIKIALTSDILQFILFYDFYFSSQTDPLTAQAELLVRSVPAVVKAITHPALGHTQMILTLELVGRAPAPPWETRGWRWYGVGEMTKNMTCSLLTLL